MKDQDPISVQALARNSREIIEELAVEAGREPYRVHALEANVGLTQRAYYAAMNRYGNAFKHIKRASDDTEIMAGFEDTMNDHLLFVGWYDYMVTTSRLPIEVQLFQIWYEAIYREKLNPSADLFPDVSAIGRAEAKERLREGIEYFRRDNKVISADTTERLPLLLPFPLSDADRSMFE